MSRRRANARSGEALRHRSDHCCGEAARVVVYVRAFRQASRCVEAMVVEWSSDEFASNSLGIGRAKPIGAAGDISEAAIRRGGSWGSDVYIK